MWDLESPMGHTTTPDSCTLCLNPSSDRAKHGPWKVLEGTGHEPNQYHFPTRGTGDSGGWTKLRCFVLNKICAADSLLLKTAETPGTPWFMYMW